LNIDTAPNDLKNRPEFCEHEWIELTPKGIVFEGSQFIFMLENTDKKAVLPLIFSLQNAELAVSPQGKSLWKKSLTHFVQTVFKHWDVELRRCVFIQHDRGQHIVRLFYVKDGEEQFLEAPLDQLFGAGLEAQVRFFATREYIADSQVLEGSPEIILQKQRWTEGRQRYLM
jgi:hypothetical protein